MEPGGDGSGWNEGLVNPTARQSYPVRDAPNDGFDAGRPRRGDRGFGEHVSRNHAPAGLAIGELRGDPGIGMLHAGAQRGPGLPMKDLLDKGVVAVASGDALGASKSKVRVRCTPAISSTMVTRSAIAISSLVPRLIGVAMRSFECMIRSMPSTQSAM